MDKMEHTPGPWVTRGLYATNDNRSAVFYTDPAKPGYSRRLDDKGAFEHADARLIAAAPDLLAALESIANSYPTTDEGETLAGIARAAIAKAHGEV